MEKDLGLPHSRLLLYNKYFLFGRDKTLLRAKVVVEIDVLVRDPSLGLQLLLNAIIFFGFTNMKPS